MRKVCDIRDRYNVELLQISRKISKLEHNRVSELTENEKDGTLHDNMVQLKTMLAELFVKIEYGGKPSAQVMSGAISNMMDEKSGKKASDEGAGA